MSDLLCRHNRTLIEGCQHCLSDSDWQAETLSICEPCGKPITEDQEKHDGGHQIGCPRKYDGDQECLCCVDDVHAECCPLCKS